MSPQQARGAARRDFGSLSGITGESYEGRGTQLLDDLGGDLRYGFRTLRKNAAFTAITVLTLALGTGACTAIFTLVNAVLLRALPYGDPKSLVYLYTPNSHFNIPPQAVGPSNADFFDLRQSNHSFVSMALFDQGQYDLATGSQPQRVEAARVDENFFATLQSSPEFGRTIQLEDQNPGNSRVVVLSHSVWQSLFAGRSDILGQKIQLNGAGYQVIGVMPPGFSYPNKYDMAFGDGHIEATRLWVPLALTSKQRSERDDSNANTIARLKPGTTLQQAKAEMSSIMSRLDLLHDASFRGWGAYIEPFLDTAIGSARSLLWLLLGAVGFVLLIACGNAANLLLARAANRSHELGVRATLGASRGRLLRQMLTESLLLSIAGGILGIFLAWFFLRILLRLDPGNIPRMQQATLDLRVLAFLLLITLLTALLFGILPSLSASRIYLAEFLKASGLRGISGDRRRTHSALIVTQVALVVVLLTGAGLLLRSYVNVLNIQSGFSPGTLTARLHPGPQYNTRQKGLNLVHAIFDRMVAIPGVQSIGMVNYAPLSNSESVSTIFVEGSPDKLKTVESRWVTPGYLASMQTRLLAGRDFIGDDLPNSSRVAIVNEAFAKEYFGAGSPLGHHLRTNTNDPWATIVGLIKDVHYQNLETAAEPQIYVPFSGDIPSSGVFLAIRSTLPEASLVAALRATVKDLDPASSLEDMHMMGDLISQAHAARRFQTTLLTVFSVIAMLLAIIGIYGLLSYSVRRRTGEIGIRMALGATRVNVVGMIVRQGIRLLVVGLVLGIAGSFALTRLLSGFLYGVRPLDPLTFTSVPLLLLAATIAACLVPASRAASIDPMEALRHE